MISYLEGKLLTQTPTYIILQVGAVGYKIFITNPSLDDLISLYIYYHVGSDNQPNLYGMSTLRQLEIFERLLKVSGVGPKLALKIIEASSEKSLESAITKGDIHFFTSIKGLGKKNAQKIILELKNKLLDPDDQPDEFIYQALMSLGFTKKEIRQTLSTIKIDDLTDQQALELTLKALGKK